MAKHKLDQRSTASVWPRAPAGGARKARRTDIRIVEPTGAETHLSVRLGDQEIVCVMSGRIGVSAGQKIRLDLSSDHAHFFDIETGQRVDA